MGRNKPHLPVRAQTFDSSGPDVRIRGNAYQVLEKYLGPQAQFNSTHTVMLENQQRLESLIRAFLRGEADTIKRLSSEMTQSMAVVRGMIPADPEHEIPAYIAVAEIDQKCINFANFHKNPH